ncbi:adenylate/guanylate cyclase domain-containing protein [Cryobacterium tagatosivorans]|nr:adenylate/guanylate cyclase domain-containing protein [Cryobacterium tagatosivorans]
MATKSSSPAPAAPTLVEQGRAALARHAWGEALEQLATADAQGQLDAGDLELLATAAWWTGQLPLAIEVRERSYAAAMKANQPAVAARAAIALARDNVYRAADSMSAAWARRAERLLESVPENAGHGWLAIVRSFRAAMVGDIETALAAATLAEEIGRRLGDRDIAAMAQAERGFALVNQGHVDEGLALVDESSVAAVAGELEPGTAGGICCTTIGTCASLGEWRRAAEWTEAQDRWCKREGISGFPGMCRLYRSEIKQLRGQWLEAEAEARRASIELENFIPAAAALALYRIGAIRLQRGDLEAAEEVLTQAHARGTKTEPAFSLLRLAQGRPAVAAASIRRALEDPPRTTTWDAPPDTPLMRMPLLRAQIEIALAAKDLATASAAVDELGALAGRFGSQAIGAGVASARGMFQLASGDAPAAEVSLRTAVDAWTRLEAPHEAARARMVLAQAYAANASADRAAVELRAAADTFERLGALIDLARARELLASLGGEDGGAPRHPDARQLKTFAFTDIVDSTKLGELLGDDAWGKLMRWHDQAVRSVVAEHGGEEVKEIGDGFFLAFDDTDRAIEAMIALQRRLARQRDTQGFAPSIRVGIHAAEATRLASDYSGTGVNIAARIAAAASGSEILVSESSLSGSRRSFGETGRRTLELKGISEPTPVVSIDWR